MRAFLAATVVSSALVAAPLQHFPRFDRELLLEKESATSANVSIGDVARSEATNILYFGTRVK